MNPTQTAKTRKARADNGPGTEAWRLACRIIERHEKGLPVSKSELEIAKRVKKGEK